MYFIDIFEFEKYRRSFMSLFIKFINKEVLTDGNPNKSIMKSYPALDIDTIILIPVNLDKVYMDSMSPL
jgi:hypothetical protein